MFYCCWDWASLGMEVDAGQHGLWLRGRASPNKIIYFLKADLSALLVSGLSRCVYGCCINQLLNVLSFLLYALFIFKQVRHTCCLLLHVYVHCIACNCLFLYVPHWLSSNARAVIPLVDWHKLTYLVLTCHKTPINQSIFCLTWKLLSVLNIISVNI